MGVDGKWKRALSFVTLRASRNRMLSFLSLLACSLTIVTNVRYGVNWPTNVILTKKYDVPYNSVSAL